MSTTAERIMAAEKARGRTEEIIYRPAGGDAREITVMVARETPDETMHATAPVIRVTALNDEDAGITPADIDTGSDGIDVAERLGGTVQTRSIRRITEQDSEFVTLEVS